MEEGAGRSETCFGDNRRAQLMALGTIRASRLRIPGFLRIWEWSSHGPAWWSCMIIMLWLRSELASRIASQGETGHCEMLPLEIMRRPRSLPLTSRSTT